MTDASAFARLTALPPIGSRIRWMARTARHGRGIETEPREGRVKFFWSNGEEQPYIETDNGTCIPELGEAWEVIDEHTT